MDLLLYYSGSHPGASTFLKSQATARQKQRDCYYLALEMRNVPSWDCNATCNISHSSCSLDMLSCHHENEKRSSRSSYQTDKLSHSDEQTVYLMLGYGDPLE